MLCLEFSKFVQNIDFFPLDSKLCNWSNSVTFLRSNNLKILTLEKYESIEKGKRRIYTISKSVKTERLYLGSCIY